jgi:hypothetical protein
MARIKIEDLPVYQEMSEEEMEAILGAGRFRPVLEELERREVMSATVGTPPVGANMPPPQAANLAATNPIMEAYSHAIHRFDNPGASDAQMTRWGASLKAIGGTDEQVAVSLQRAHFSSAQIGAALKGFGDSDVLAAVTLRQAGFTPQSIGQALNHGYGDTLARIAAALESANASLGANSFSLENIRQALHNDQTPAAAPQASWNRVLNVSDEGFDPGARSGSSSGANTSSVGDNGPAQHVQQAVPSVHEANHAPPPLSWNQVTNTTEGTQ